MLHLSRLIGWINCDGNIDMGQPSTLSEKLAVIGVHGMASDHSYISIIFKFQILTDIRPAYINDPGHYSLKVCIGIVIVDLRRSDSCLKWESLYHDYVINWKRFPRYWPFVRGIHRSPVNSPHKGQWSGALVFSLICVWINGSVNNG